MQKSQDLKALLNLISEAEVILLTTELPQGRAERARELLRSAVKLADELTKTPPAAVPDAEGAKATAKRGPQYSRKAAALRKATTGGRPKKKA